MSHVSEQPVDLFTGRLAELVNGTLCGAADVAIGGINAMDRAGPRDITIIADSKYLRGWAACRAGAALIADDLVPVADTSHEQRPLIAVPDVDLASVVLLEHFAPPPPEPAAGVHPTAWIHPHATLGRDVRIGAHVSVDQHAIIGDGVVLHPGVRVYPDVAIGDGSCLHAGVVVRERCRIGRRVILGPGVAIGHTGFGFRPAADGAGLVALPHLGTVEIGDDVEIGSNSCVDRGKFGATEIGPGTKIDNLVQIGHNCRIGRHCVIAAMTGVGGSVRMGDWVQVGGGAAFRDHLTIGQGARIAGKSGVTRDVEPGEAVFGYPADTARDALRQVACVRKLPELFRKLSQSADTERR